MARQMQVHSRKANEQKRTFLSGKTSKNTKMDNDTEAVSVLLLHQRFMSDERRRVESRTDQNSTADATCSEAAGASSCSVSIRFRFVWSDL